MKKLLKNNLPHPQMLLKISLVLLMIGLSTTYVGIALTKQDTLQPYNPLSETVNSHSQVPLMGHNKDLIHAEQITDEEIETEDNEEELEEEDNADTNINDDHLEDSGENKQDNVSRDENHTNQETNDENRQEGSGDNGNNDPDSRNLEVTEETDSADYNDYFATSFTDGETVTEKDYSFHIEQHDHDYPVRDIHVSIDSADGKIENITDHNNGSAHVNATLSEGDNKISLTVTYEDENGEPFSVSNTYTVIFDKTNIIIQSNLEDGQVVYQENLTFQANAKRGNEEAPLTVKLNAEEVASAAKDQYEVALNEGENEITIESKYKGSQAQQQFTIHYDKPDLKIETNLSNQTVDEPDFTFTAKAFDGSQEADLTVVQNATEVKENEEGTYSVTLAEGENIFELTAAKGDVTHSETYTVTYNLDAGSGGDPDDNENAPTINVYDLEDGQTLKSSSYTFHVRGEDYKGNSLTEGNGSITLTNNGNRVHPNWRDGDQISFTLDVQNGENDLFIEAADDEGNSATKELTVYGDLAEQGKAIGTITFSVEATTIGLGNLIGPKEVEIYEGENGAHLLDRLLTEHGFTYDHTGSFESSFYLSALYKADLVTNPVIPEDLAELLERDMDRFNPDDYRPDSLREFDFTNGSGWMYSVNGNYPNVGFSDWHLKDGDVLRVRYQLAFGRDIGGGPGENYHKEW